MSKRSTIERQINAILFSKQGFGESRHEAKNQLREQLGENYHFGTSDNKIHSYATFDTYQKACQRFGKWLQEEKGIGKKEDIQKCKCYVGEYLHYRLNTNNVSVWTAKMERSALAKLYGEKIEVTLPKRDTKDITRSRGEKEHDKHFSEDNHRALINMVKATGCRRCDIQRLTPKCFYTDKSGVMWVRIEKSKGGRNRTAPVLPEYRAFVEEYLKGRNENRHLFSKIPQAADIHSYRDEYTRELYKAVKNDKDLKNTILQHYPERHEYKVVKDKETGERKIYEIKSDTITTRGENRQTFNRNDIYICSQALGHNRLNIVIDHYLHT